MLFQVPEILAVSFFIIYVTIEYVFSEMFKSLFIYNFKHFVTLLYRIVHKRPYFDTELVQHATKNYV